MCAATKTQSSKQTPAAVQQRTAEQLCSESRDSVHGAGGEHVTLREHGEGYGESGRGIYSKLGVQSKRVFLKE